MDILIAELLQKRNTVAPGFQPLERRGNMLRGFHPRVDYCMSYIVVTKQAMPPPVCYDFTPTPVCSQASQEL